MQAILLSLLLCVRPYLVGVGHGHHSEPASRVVTLLVLQDLHVLDVQPARCSTERKTGWTAEKDEEEECAFRGPGSCLLGRELYMLEAACALYRSLILTRQTHLTCPPKQHTPMQRQQPAAGPFSLLPLSPRLPAALTRGLARQHKVQHDGAVVALHLLYTAWVHCQARLQVAKVESHWHRRSCSASFQIYTTRLLSVASLGAAGTSMSLSDTFLRHFLANNSQ